MADPADIRLLRQSLLAMRGRIVAELEALDAELARLEPEFVPSFQVPKSWKGFLTTKQ
jgi:hypothetical protein